MRKNPTQLRGTNFCTSLARFAPSFVRQPNSTECTQIVRMHQNVSIGSNGVDRVRSLRKIPMQLRGTNFCTSSARFALSFVRRLNGPECTQKVRTAPKRQLLSNWVDRVRSLRKCTQIVRNAPKRHFRVQRGGSGAFVAKNSDATSWHELLHLFGQFYSEFRKATKWS